MITKPAADEGEGVFDLAARHAVEVGEAFDAFALEEVFDAELAEFGAQAVGAFGQRDDQRVIEPVGQAMQPARDRAGRQTDEAGEGAATDPVLEREFDEHSIAFFEELRATEHALLRTAAQPMVDRLVVEH
jgi:hypothetical protein